MKSPKAKYSRINFRNSMDKVFEFLLINPTFNFLASFFILVNSLSGLLGLWTSGTFEVLWPETLVLLIAVFIGGQIGVRLSLNTLSAKTVRLLTAGLVLFVGFRILLSNGLELPFFV